jgi:hypothetical protein
MSEYVTGDAGKDAVKLVNCLIEVANATHPRAYYTLGKVIELNKTSELHVFSNKRLRKEIESYIADMKKDSEEIVLKHYGESIKPSFYTSTGYEYKSGDLLRFSLTPSKLLEGELKSNGYEDEPAIEVRFRDLYETNPLEFLNEISKLGLKNKTEITVASPFPIGLEGNQWLAKLKDKKTLFSLLENGIFESGITLERGEEYFTPEGTLTQAKNHISTDFESEIEITKRTISPPANTAINATYSINANNLAINLPKQETDFLDSIINKLANPQASKRNK